MSDIYGMRQAAEEIRSLAEGIESDLDGIEWAVDQWDELKGNYESADSIKEEICRAEEWLNLAGETGLDADEVARELDSLDGIRTVFLEYDCEVRDAISADAAVQKLAGKGPDGEVMAAIQILISALHKAGVLGGTGTVPAMATIEPTVPASDESSDTNNKDKE